MRLAFLAQAAADQREDEIHAWMIAHDPAYAASVASGQTLRWDIPRRAVDADGNPTGTTWYVQIEQRCLGALTAVETKALLP